MASATNNSQMCGSCHDVVTPARRRARAHVHRVEDDDLLAQRPANLLPLTCCGLPHAEHARPGRDRRQARASTCQRAATAFTSTCGRRSTGAHARRCPAATCSRPASSAILDPAITIVGPDADRRTAAAGARRDLRRRPRRRLRSRVRIDSRGTGHMWPSGAAQDRRAWLEVIAYDASNNVVFQTRRTCPTDKDPEEIADPNLVRDAGTRTFKDDGTPAHFFWEVADDRSVAPDPAADHARPDRSGVRSLDERTRSTSRTRRSRSITSRRASASGRSRYACSTTSSQSGDLDPAVAAQLEDARDQGDAAHVEQGDGAQLRRLQSRPVQLVRDAEAVDGVVRRPARHADRSSSHTRPASQIDRRPRVQAGLTGQCDLD